MGLYIKKTEQQQQQAISYAVTTQDCEKLVRSLYDPKKQIITNVVVKQKIGEVVVEWIDLVKK